MPRRLEKTAKGDRQLTCTVPALDINRLRRAAQDRGVCRIEWRDGERRLRYLAKVELGPDDIEVRSGFESTEDHIVVLRWSCEGDRRNNHVIYCPMCGGRFRVIYMYLGVWRCRNCHGLGYSTQYLSVEELARDDLAVSKAEVAGGRPRYMRLKEYDHKLEYIAKLEHEVAEFSSKLRNNELSRRRFTAAYFTGES